MIPNTLKYILLNQWQALGHACPIDLSVELEAKILALDQHNERHRIINLHVPLYWCENLPLWQIEKQRFRVVEKEGLEENMWTSERIRNKEAGENSIVREVL